MRTTRAERVAFVERMRRNIDKDVPPRPTTSASRKRIVEVLALEAGLPPPRWKGAPRERPEPIDDTPWREARQASLRAQHQRFGRFGLALTRDGTIRCVKCKEVVLAIPRNRPVVIGAPISLLVAQHQEEGCR